MRVFVTGAAGFVGRHLVGAYLDAGHEVIAVVHDCDKAEILPQDGRVEVRQADVRDRDALRRALAGAEAGSHLVAILGEELGSTYQQVNVEGVRNVVDACRDLGIRRLLHQSTIGADPDTSVEYQASKWQGQEIVEQSDLDWTVFRPSLIIGEASGVAILLLALTKLPAVPIFGKGDTRFQPVSIRDVCACHVQAMEKPETIRQVYEVCGPETFTYEQMIEAVAEVQSHAKPLFHLPVWTARWPAEGLERLPLEPPVSGDAVLLLQYDNVCRDDCAQRAFSLPGVTLRDELRRILAARERAA